MAVLKIGRTTIDIDAVKKLSKKDLKAMLANKSIKIVEAIEKALDKPKKKSKQTEIED
jgi:hypothetical protein